MLFFLLPLDDFLCVSYIFLNPSGWYAGGGVLYSTGTENLLETWPDEGNRGWCQMVWAIPNIRHK
jgi:hypothetical protein